MLSSPWEEGLSHGGEIREIITQSVALREAADSDLSACCVARFPGRCKTDQCPAHQFCERGKIEIPAGLVEGPYRKPRLPRFRMPRLIPLINPCDERTFAHRYLEDAFPVVAVQLWKLVRSGPAYRLAISKGLSRMLGFDGRIIVSSVMPDSDIMRRGVDWFIKTLDELKPDAVITWDVPTYSDHPKKASLNWMLAGLEASRRMSLELDTPLIGLVSGADLAQVRLSSKCLRKMGFEYQALACHELLLTRQQAYLKSCASIVAGNCSDLTLLSCTHPNLFERFRVADHFVGMSWFNQAVRGRRLAKSNRAFESRRNSTLQLIRENLVETIHALPGSPRGSFQEALDTG